MSMLCLQPSMSTRRVPAALHHELSEYASLLRALRTRDTLDVTKHLTKASPFDVSQAGGDLHPSSEEDEMDEMLDKLSKSNRFSSTLSSYTDDARSSRSRSRSRDNGVTCRKKQVPRDHWTRWPLMLDDVLEPEWTLEDEVAVVTSQVLRETATPLSLQTSLANNLEEPEEDLVVLDMQLEDDDPDHAYFIPSLTHIISNYLSAILGQLAALTPPRPASMQNRIEPLAWRAVIDAVVSLGDPEYSNPKVLQNVIHRLEAVYGSPEGELSTSHRAIDRAEQLVALEETRHQHQEKLVASLFDQASPPPSRVYPIDSSSGSCKQATMTEHDMEEREFVARRRWIAKGKQPERRKACNTVSNADQQPRRSSRNKKDNSRDGHDSSP